MSENNTKGYDSAVNGLSCRGCVSENTCRGSAKTQRCSQYRVSDRNTLPSATEKPNNNQMVDLVRGAEDELKYRQSAPCMRGTGKTTQVLQQLIETVMASKPGKVYYMLGVTFRQAHSIMQYYLEDKLLNRQIMYTSVIGEVRVNNCSIRFKSKRQYDTICKRYSSRYEPKAFADHTVLEAIVAEGLDKISNQLKSITGG